MSEGILVLFFGSGFEVLRKVAFRDEVLEVGGKVKYGTYEWVVEEVWEWE